MRLLMQAALLGAASSVLFGDFGSPGGQIPLLLGQPGSLRSRARAEREADDEAIVPRAAGLSPAVMVTLFERLAAWTARAATTRR